MIHVWRLLASLAAVGLLPVSGESQTAPAREHQTIHEIVAAVSPDRIERDIRTLVGFGTRHTASDTLSDTRGIGAARRWIKAEFDRISAECGGCLEVQFVAEIFPPSRRLPESTNIVNVVAVQRGISDPSRMVIMSGDIDAIISRGLGMDATDSVPGANDNASGMAGTLEAARVLTQHRFAGSIVYLGLSGEEQGLYGGGTVARYAREHGWNIVGVLNNDMIGNIEGIAGITDNTTARVFSDPTPISAAVRARVDSTIERLRTLTTNGDTTGLDNALAQMRTLTELQWSLMRRQGGEVDGASRQLARYVDVVADTYLPTLDIMMIYRLDRFGRGGHHTPFANLGYPGVRIMESHENYTRQHQDIRVEDGIRYGDVLEKVDFDYAAKLTALNAATLASLAWAPGPPRNVALRGAVRPAATLTWTAPSDAENVAGYRVYWRLTDSPTWDHSRWVGNVGEFRFEGMVVDNYFFGVAAVATSGAESTIVFPLPQPPPPR